MTVMDLKKFAKKADKKKGKLIKFLNKLDRIVPEDLPVLVAEIEKAVWEDVNCLECANCCKTMTPTYTNKDIARISKHMGMTPKQFKDKWLYKDEDGDWMNTATPCQFLGSDNKCTIYEIRPADCAEFPHHNKKPFELYNDTFIGNVPRCPATFELVNKLRKRVEKEYEW
ncbi:MAG: YkgJ family cysteine cluster protein [Chitinophagaceae bacterium]|nr:YkgJ family cysteine cluster protein [Chitinophagaceae bacterium]MCB9044728.1 YkgJ family cysteine cluster protein [Chitinophagales bacterium]